MKKFLSLVLALVMTMSLVTISAGAKDFTDDSKINYEEAVDVMSAVKVIDGYADGSFNPQGSLTRGAAAKIICNLILGPTTAAALSADTAPYKDVPVNHTFAGYIAYCQQQGIISGYADGTFRPAATLTNYAFLKMLLGALGYDAQVEGYVGDNWSIQVAKRALAIGLTDGMITELNGTEAATREQACLYALNTMKATMVDYDTKTTVTVGGAEVVVAGSTAQDVKWTGTKNADGNIKDDNLVQFAEKYFENLKLEGGVGIYGRPANTWILKTKEIGTYVTTAPDYVYTAATKQNKIYKAVGKTIATEFEWEAYVDGAELGEIKAPVNKDEKYIVTVDDTKINLSVDGMTTELYVDEDAKTVTVVCINQYLAEVTRVKEDEDDGTYAVLKVYKYDNALDDDTFFTDEFEEEEYVVVTIDCVDQDEDKAYIATAEAPETVTGKVTLINEKDNQSDGSKYMELDSSDKYDYSSYILGDLDNGNEDPELKEEYKLFLDSNGFVLGFLPTKDVTGNYLYVEKAHEALKMDAEVIFPDATEATIRIDDIDSARSFPDDDSLKGNVFFFDYDEKKDVYDVYNDGVYPDSHGIGDKVEDAKAVNNGTTDVTIVNNRAYMSVEVLDASGNVVAGAKDAATYIVGLKTIFVDVEDAKAYVGYKEVPSYRDADFIPVDHNNDGVVDIVFITAGDKYDDETVYFYLTGTDKDTTNHTVDGKKVLKYTKAYAMDGKKTPLYLQASGAVVTYPAPTGAKTEVIKAGLYKIDKTNSTGEYVKEMTYLGDWTTAGLFETVFSQSTSPKEGSFWTVGSNEQKYMYTYDEETQFAVINLKYNYDKQKVEVDSVKPGSPSDLKGNAAFVDADSKNIAETVIILSYADIDTKTVTFKGDHFDIITVSGLTAQGGNKYDAIKGSKVEFKLTDDVGYKVTKVTVGDKELEADAAGVYTIDEVSSNTTVTVTTVPYSTATVTVDDNANSAVVKVNGAAIDPAGYEVGTDVTITVQQAAGQNKISSVVVDGVELTAVGGVYTYSAKMPAGGVTLIVTADDGKQNQVFNVFFSTNGTKNAVVDIAQITKECVDGKYTLTRAEVEAELSNDAYKVTTFTAPIGFYSETPVEVIVTVAAKSNTATITASDATIKADSSDAPRTQTVTIDSNGTLTGVEVTDATDTSGVGTADVADLDVNIDLTDGTLTINVAGGATLNATDVYEITISGLAEDGTTVITKTINVTVD